MTKVFKCNFEYVCIIPCEYLLVLFVHALLTFYARFINSNSVKITSSSFWTKNIAQFFFKYQTLQVSQQCKSHPFSK